MYYIIKSGSHLLGVIRASFSKGFGLNNIVLESNVWILDCLQKFGFIKLYLSKSSYFSNLDNIRLTAVLYFNRYYWFHLQCCSINIGKL